MKEWFEDWFNSPYYHTLYRHRNDEEAQAFVEKIVAYFQLSAKQTLLDLACGKGRHSLAFNKLGLDVTGVDLSSNSIDHALQFANENLHFYVHDMRNTFRTNYYDMVCNLFTSFGYFTSSHDNIAAARAMFQCAKKGGMVLIDFVNREHAIQNILARKHEELEMDSIQFIIDRDFDDDQFLKKIKVKDGENTFEFQERLSSFTLDQMKEIFQSVGFKFNHVFGNYQFDEYNKLNSPRMILIFEK